MSVSLSSQAQPACAPDPVAVDRQMRRVAALPEPAWLHREVARRLAEKLEPIKLNPTSWVDWSAHAGAGQEFVQSRYPDATRWVVEPHPSLAQASERLAQERGRRSWRSLFRREVEPVFAEPVSRAPWLPGGVQMVWANMALHASTRLAEMMGQWHRHLAIEGFLMCSGLGPDTARELRAVYREMGWPLPTIDFID
ncbi:MAG TPA: biotin synthase, partial [Aquabacterium sp.]|nr:biotin synthase [Aquabacterium sp.]